MRHLRNLGARWMLSCMAAGLICGAAGAQSIVVNTVADLITEITTATPGTAKTILLDESGSPYNLTAALMIGNGVNITLTGLNSGAAGLQHPERIEITSSGIAFDVMQGGKLSLTNLTVTGASTAIAVTSAITGTPPATTLTLQRCYINENSAVGVLLTGLSTSAIIQNTAITANDSHGVHVDNMARVTLVQTTLKDNKGDGVFFEDANDTAASHVVACLLHNNVNGIRFVDGMVTLRANLIYASSAMDINGTLVDPDPVTVPAVNIFDPGVWTGKINIINQSDIQTAIDSSDFPSGVTLKDDFENQPRASTNVKAGADEPVITAATGQWIDVFRPDYMNANGGYIEILTSGITLWDVGNNRGAVVYIVPESITDLGPFTLANAANSALAVEITAGMLVGGNPNYAAFLFTPPGTFVDLGTATDVLLDGQATLFLQDPNAPANLYGETLTQATGHISTGAELRRRFIIDTTPPNIQFVDPVSGEAYRPYDYVLSSNDSSAAVAAFAPYPSNWTPAFRPIPSNSGSLDPANRSAGDPAIFLNSGNDYSLDLTVPQMTLTLQFLFEDPAPDGVPDGVEVVTAGFVDDANDFPLPEDREYVAGGGSTPNLTLDPRPNKADPLEGLGAVFTLNDVPPSANEAFRRVGVHFGTGFSTSIPPAPFLSSEFEFECAYIVPGEEWMFSGTLDVSDLAGNTLSLRGLPNPYRVWWLPDEIPALDGPFDLKTKYSAVPKAPFEQLKGALDWGLARVGNPSYTAPGDAAPSKAIAQFALYRAIDPNDVYDTTWVPLFPAYLFAALGEFSDWTIDQPITLSSFVAPGVRLIQVMDELLAPGDRVTAVIRVADEAGNVSDVTLGSPLASADIFSSVDAESEFYSWTHGVDTQLDTAVRADFWHNSPNVENGDGDRSPVDGVEPYFSASNRIPQASSADCARVEARFTVQFKLPEAATLSPYAIWNLYEDGRRVAGGTIREDNLGTHTATLVIPGDLLNLPSDGHVTLDFLDNFLNLPEPVCGEERDRLGDYGYTRTDQEKANTPRDVEYLFTVGTVLGLEVDIPPASTRFVVTTGRKLKEDQPIKTFKRE
ncbi:MAG: right-handed parallel beta-helix repeat-containing protein [Candidatus Hydrogenedentes bacterium]|nr:right-handed parallel beta-helix repeat-containing protein [Candidatus Hydrogenedentota bacterium]